MSRHATGPLLSLALTVGGAGCAVGEIPGARDTAVVADDRSAVDAIDVADVAVTDRAVREATGGDTASDGTTDAGREAGADVVLDVGADAVPGPDGGADGGREAGVDAAPEPAREPGPEATPEPTPEPGVDAGPEAAAEPVPEAGTDVTVAPDVVDASQPPPDVVADVLPACPTARTLGTFDANAEGWALDGLWRWDAGALVAGSTTRYSSTYTQNVTSPTDVDLRGCSSALLTFLVRLADDPNYEPNGDKSERLYPQCSGDGGGSWTNLTPSSWPVNQTDCATSFCSGRAGASRAFPWTSQAIALPAACRTDRVRIRFQAKGSSVWRLQDPGWYVDAVRIN